MDELTKFLSPAALGFLALSIALVMVLGPFVQYMVAFWRGRIAELSGQWAILASLAFSGGVCAIVLYPGVLQPSDGVRLFHPFVAWLLLTLGVFFRASGGWDFKQQQGGG